MIPVKLISKKKEIYPVGPGLDRYLRRFNRSARLSINYDDLLSYSDCIALYDRNGEDTLWSSLSYSPSEQRDIDRGLLELYAWMRAEGDLSILHNLKVDRIDLCLYGNTKPLRIRIANRLNDNFEYYYIKRTDASRIYGLELEHILSPNRISFLYYGGTLVEDHIYGIPGDVFLHYFFRNPDLNKVRLAKEFVKFNERCFLRLLGDMHCANFVVDITMDFEMNFYRIRGIDFDQQSYEGRKKIYLPQFFKENHPYVDLVLKTLSEESIEQYRKEERSLIHRRVKSAAPRLNRLLDLMEKDPVAPEANVKSLAKALADHHGDDRFLRCTSMGALVRTSLGTLEKS